MDLWEAVFSIDVRGRYNELSLEFSDTRFLMWYVWNRQILKFGPCSPEGIAGVRSFLNSHGLAVEKELSFQDGALMLIREDSGDELDVWSIADRNMCIELPPATFSVGTAEYRFAGFDEASIKALISDLGKYGKVELKSKRKLPINVLRSTMWMSSIFSNLTEKQMQCMINAQLSGYYRIPRSTGTEQLASKSGLSRSTFEAHLRKAENTVINSLVPYLQLFMSTRDDDFHHLTVSSPRMEL